MAILPDGLGDVGLGPKGGSSSRSRLMASLGGDHGLELGLPLLTPSTPPSDKPFT